MKFSLYNCLHDPSSSLLGPNMVSKYRVPLRNFGNAIFKRTDNFDSPEYEKEGDCMTRTC
jgi:hypothetical protein